MSLITKERFTFEQPLFAHSSYVNKIVDMALKLINAKDSKDNFLFVERILIPLIQKIFEEGGTPFPERIVLDKFIKDVFDTWCVTLHFPGKCTKAAFARTDRNGTSIHFNLDWIIRADLVYDRVSSIPLEEVSKNLETSIHVVVGCVKLVHEILHTLTDRILAFEYIEHSKIPNTTNVKLEDTPKKIGSRKQGGVIFGDLGNGFEELLFGNNLRMVVDWGNVNVYKWIATGIYFEQQTHQEVVSVSSRVNAKRKRLFGEEVPVMLPPKIAFSFDMHEFIADEYLYEYLYYVRLAFESESSMSGEKLYKVFLLDKEEELQLRQHEHGRNRRNNTKIIVDTSKFVRALTVPAFPNWFVNLVREIPPPTTSIDSLLRDHPHPGLPDFFPEHLHALEEEGCFGNEI